MKNAWTNGLTPPPHYAFILCSLYKEQKSWACSH